MTQTSIQRINETGVNDYGCGEDEKSMVIPYERHSLRPDNAKTLCLFGEHGERQGVIFSPFAIHLVCRASLSHSTGNLRPFKEKLNHAYVLQMNAFPKRKCQIKYA